MRTGIRRREWMSGLHITWDINTELKGSRACHRFTCSGVVIICLKTGKKNEQRIGTLAVGRNRRWHRHCGKQCGGSSKKVKIELLYDPAILLLGLYPKELKAESWRDTRTPVFTAALFTFHIPQKMETTPVSISGWGINKMRYILTMEYYSVSKRKMLLQEAMTWKNVEVHMLHEWTHEWGSYMLREISKS